MSIGNTPPAHDQIEVSIFGPGTGEALAIHLGGGRWMTVDSCKDAVNKTHPVLEYFTRIGVDVASDVDYVVGTHAHDDHIAGLSDLVAAAQGASFITSQVFLAEEFFAAVETEHALGSGIRSRIMAEYRAIFETLETRAGTKKPIQVVSVQQQHPVHFRDPAWPGGPTVSITALSPTPTAVWEARKRFAEALAQPGEERSLKVFNPNFASVAMWVQVGNLALILGADLETAPTHMGWQAVHDQHTPSVKASLFKIPHHGSSNAHHQGTWEKFVAGDSVALIAPFRQGNTDLPRAEDVTRIVQRAGRAYSTARPAAPLSPEDQQQLDRVTGGRNVKPARREMGQVQARQTYGSDIWDVRMDGPAHLLP